MKRRVSAISIVLTGLVMYGHAIAQDATPSPTPVVSDGRATAPENLNGVPAIAPTYRSDERRLPDLARVGVEMSRHRTLTVREAVELALENNRDIEVSRKT